MPAATGSSVLAGGLRLASRWGLGFWGQFGFWGFRDSGLGGSNICKSNISPTGSRLDVVTHNSESKVPAQLLIKS